MNSATPAGLATVAQVEALADQLSACADTLHARILKDIKGSGGARPSDKAQAAARALLDDELLLRQRANALYVDAASLALGALGKEVQHVAALTAVATEQIRKIAVIANVTGLVGSLLQLAAAAAAGHPAPLVLALEKVGKQVKALDALAPGKPA
jgi:hypothetical protein